MGENENRLGAAPNPRCRVSAWVDPTVFMNGKTVTRPVKQSDGSVKNVDFFEPNMNNLFKKDALVKEVFSGGPDPKNGFRVLDDVSLLKTFREDRKTTDMKIVWDDSILQGATDDRRRDFFQQVIKHCHDVLGVQCLVGYGLIDAANTQLDKWLKESVPDPSIDAVTDEIIKFCEANLPGYDGISLDIEGLTPNAGNVALVKKNLVEFYQTLARKLLSPPIFSRNLPQPAKFNAGYDRIVAFAAAHLIGKVKDPPTPQKPNPTSDGKMKKSRLLKHEGNDPKKPLLRDGNDFVSKSVPQNADFAFQVHDYDAPHGDRNLIVRPMAYDNFDQNSSLHLLDDWHADICRYVSNDLNLHPGNFQLGVKTLPGSGQLEKGMDGVMGGSFMNIDPSTRITHVRERCRNLLSLHKYGIVFFPTSKGFWKDANEALNPSVPEAGRVAGEPIQCPLNKAALAILNKVPKSSLK